MESEMKNNAAMSAQEQDPKTMEIVPGMTVEEMTALYFNANALREPAYKIYQLNSDGHRYYYRYEDGEPHFYPSVTTLLKQTMPTSPYLIEWMIKNGTDGSAEKRDLAAAYGTFMHAQFERLLINRCYDFDAVPGILLEYMAANNLPDKFYAENLTKIRKDVCAFAQFVKDYNVRPLAVEIALVHPDYNYAGMIDLPCLMDFKNEKNVPTIVDFKSGRKGFYEEHEIQLHLYKDMWNANFPSLPITRVFNFSPKDWRGVKPTYNLKDQTESPNAAKIPALLELARIEDYKMDNTFTIISGEFSLDNFDGSCITSLSLSDLIKTKAAAKQTAPSNGGFVPKSTPSVTKPAETVQKDNEFDICEFHCKNRNCDYNFGSHAECGLAKLDYMQSKEAKQAATGRKATKTVNTTSEAKKAVKTDFAQNLLNAEIEL